MIGFASKGYSDDQNRIGYENACDYPKHEILVLKRKQISGDLKVRANSHNGFHARCGLRNTLPSGQVRYQVADDAAAACVLCAVRQSREGCPMAPPGHVVQCLHGACCAVCVRRHSAQSTTTFFADR